MLGLYLHVPFCIRKCAYCDFLSFPATGEEQEEYVRALLDEITNNGAKYGNRYAVNSIFIGGGTPSLLREGLVEKIIFQVKSSFGVDVNSEITIESNPRTLTSKKLAEYLNAGVNRLSLGAQSMDDSVLETLGRVHDAEAVFESFLLARKSGFSNINLDLMFGIPGQSLEGWLKTLQQAVSLSPDHISFYSLQLEEGTPIYEKCRDGILLPLPEETDRRMYHEAIALLQDAGYVHYEISNAAKPDFACRHNLKYWSMEEYLGMGLGAHSYVDGERFSNQEEWDGYVRSGAGEKVRERHRNTRRDDMEEYLFTGLRKREGIDLMDFSCRFGISLQEAYAGQWSEIEKHIRTGGLTLRRERMWLTVEGIDISNQIFINFIGYENII